jgi:hypothetical protein
MDKIRKKINLMQEAEDDRLLSCKPKAISKRLIKSLLLNGMDKDASNFIEYNKHFGFKPDTLAGCR